MKPLLLALLALTPLAFAQTLGFSEALQKAAAQATVQSAAAELADAKANLDRVLSDPLLTRPTELQARQRLALADASYKRGLAQAEASIAGAYAQVLEAQSQLRTARKGVEVAQKGLEAAQIRARNGSGTALDVRNAQARLDDSQRGQTAAENGLALAERSLRSLVGDFSAVAALPSPPNPAVPLPAIQGELLQSNPDRLQAAQRAELARLQVELLDPSYSARADIDAAKVRLEQAEAGLKELSRSLGLQIEGLYQQVQNTSRGLSIAQNQLQNAREQLAADRRRFEAGLISQIAFLQGELTSLQSEAAWQQAQGAYFRALYNLYASGGGR